MTDKEKIIIDGKKEKVNILFECNHIEDIEAFDMIKQGIEITPQNAPVGDLKIKIISNIHSPYGFSSICSRSKKSEDWEYMGFGHSGACSVTTALLKALQRKEQECEELKKQCNEHRNNAESYCNSYQYSCAVNGKITNKALKYRQALDEIEKELKECVYCESQECGCDDFEECLRCTKDQILDIINKARDGE